MQDMKTTAPAEAAAIVTAGTVLVLAPINPQPLRDLLANLDTPTPTPEPVFDEALFARIRDSLGLNRRFHLAPGETPTRFSVWSIHELEDVFVHGHVDGTVTARQAERILSDGDTYTVIEITLTVDLPGVGRVDVFADWIPADEPHGFDLRVIQALRATV